LIEVIGKAGIIAKILADSVNEQGNRLVTYELTYPRLIHSELLTHKMLCSNSASSRAIPFAKMAEQLTAQPVRFGQANPGMQDKGVDFDAAVFGLYSAGEAWLKAKDAMVYASDAFYNAGYHKQVYNRLTEPFQMMKTVISGTEWDNFFWLRNDSAADPTLHELARCMFEALEQSVPQLLKAGEWHLPYIDVDYADIGNGEQQFYFLDETHCMGDNISLEDAIKVSCARTAAVSFRNEDYGLDKCLEVYARLIDDERKHASAMQHAAAPIQQTHCSHDCHTDDLDPYNSVNVTFEPRSWQKGISHVTRDGKLWSAQYCGWIMHRKTIPGENYAKEKQG